jgi:hypothetical protein
MTPEKKKEEDQAPAFDDVLKRMLTTPPMHKVKKKPADKPADKKKPA